MQSEKILLFHSSGACPRPKRPAGTPSKKSPPLKLFINNMKKKKPIDSFFLKWITRMNYFVKVRVPIAWTMAAWNQLLQKDLNSFTNLSFKAPPFPPKQLFILVALPYFWIKRHAVTGTFDFPPIDRKLWKLDPLFLQQVGGGKWRGGPGQWSERNVCKEQRSKKNAKQEEK